MPVKPEVYVTCTGRRGSSDIMDMSHVKDDALKLILTVSSSLPGRLLFGSWDMA